MTKRNYVVHEQVTKEILDAIQVGDRVRCNAWGKPMQVVGVSPNYFVMHQNLFGKGFYSVCEKKSVEHSRNSYTKGNFRIGTDDYIFGAPGGYPWDDAEWVEAYLAGFESGKINLSVRRAVNLEKIAIASEVEK